jgi:colanic acid biosynthesis glycosyl transferase WcaI
VRVLVLAQYFPPDMGGGATRAHNVVRGLSLAGCDVTVVTPFPNYPTGNVPTKYRKSLLKVEYEGKVKVIRTFVPPIPSKGFSNRVLLFSSFVFSSLLALPFAERIDVIWAANPNIIAVFPSLFYGFTNHCKIFQNVDDLWPETLYDLGLDRRSFIAKFGEFVAKFTYGVSSGITPLSPAYVGVLSHKYGVDRKKISIVLAGVDCRKFKVEKKQPKRERFKVLYIGSFSPAYDFDQILKAAKALAAIAKVDFVIQGGGELANDLKCKVKEFGLDNVEIIEKIVSRDEVAEIMADADALLLPLSSKGSIEMGISSKLYEYQAAGKPILCCSNGQPGRFVSETESGIVVKPGDSEMLQRAIIRLIENPEFAEKLGNSGRKYVQDNLSIEQIGSAMKEILNNNLLN